VAPARHRGGDGGGMSRNESDTYLYPPTGEHLTRVTTILDETTGKQRYLVPWSARLAAECAVDNLDVLEAVLSGRAFAVCSRETGRQGAVDLAKNQAKDVRDLKRDVGSYVHSVVEALILWQASPEGCGSDLELPPLPGHLAGQDYDDDPVEIIADWMIEGFLNFVADFKPQFHAAEMTVFNYPLGVAGTLDMIVTLPGLAIGPAGRFIPGDGVTPCIDVKTGKNPDKTWREQIAAYRHAPEADPGGFGDLVPMPATDAGAVLHLRPEHPRGYRLNLISGAADAKAWNRFRRDVEIYQGRKAEGDKPGKVCYPLRADGTVRQPLIADLDGEGYGRALSPLAKAGIADLEQLATMDAGDVLKVKGVGGKVLDVIRLMLADHGLHLRGEAPEAAEPLKAVA
jgi:hypothetical protein